MQKIQKILATIGLFLIAVCFSFFIGTGCNPDAPDDAEQSQIISTDTCASFLYSPALHSAQMKKNMIKPATVKGEPFNFIVYDGDNLDTVIHKLKGAGINDIINRGRFCNPQEITNAQFKKTRVWIDSTAIQ